MSFAAELQKACDRAKDRAVETVRLTALGVHAGMARRAPVDTGRLKSNFQVGIGSINTATNAPAGSDPAPAAAAALATWRPGQTIWVTNSLPYARVAEFGLYGKPTTINNTETFAAVPWIIRNGGQAYLEIGKPNNGGTKIYSVSGDVELPGNYEIPLGTPFSKLLELAGGVRKGRTLKAVIPGGSSAPVLPADIMMACTMDYDSIAKAGSMLGSGALIVMDETRCMVKSLLRLSYFYMHESCGQCTPCREGTGWLWRVMDRIENGKGRPEDIDMLNSVADNIQGRTICALGDAAAMPVRAFIKHYRDEFVHHIEHKTCMVPAYI